MAVLEAQAEKLAAVSRQPALAMPPAHLGADVAVKAPDADPDHAYKRVLPEIIRYTFSILHGTTFRLICLAQ